jgi:cytochrome c
MDRLLTRPRPVLAGLLLAAGLFAALPATAGDASHGKSLFGSQCAVCHSAARNGPTIIGPTLFGVVGRPAASVKGFAYSSAMKASGITWSNDVLATYLPAPSKLVPGTKMSFAGVKNPDNLADLIAYLDTLK